MFSKLISFSIILLFFRKVTPADEDHGVCFLRMWMALPAPVVKVHAAGQHTCLL